MNDIGETMRQYGDIIGLPHHVSPSRPRMSRLDRAAQFSPFAALAGFDAVLAETGRLTDEFVDLDEDAKAALDDKLRWLADHIGEMPEAAITCFVPDKRKDGGAYKKVVGTIKKLDEFERCIFLADGTKIPIWRIFDIEYRVPGTAE